MRLYPAPSAFVNLGWLRLCQIDPPRHPSLFGNGAPRSYQFGFVSPSPNSQNLPARGISHYLKDMLFEPFYPSFCFIFWPTSLSMSCEVNQKSAKKSFKKSNSLNSGIVS
ncbi:MAG: hypothetical protein K940chlam6_00609 [Chlamydiae bacterium]|nr:hypothetical protein [Chlamydiota bacterium]